MTFDFYSFVHFVFVGFIALFPVVNPIGSAFIVSPYISELPQKNRKNAIKRITFYAFSLCLITLLAGHWILELFGLSIPIIQLAGGIMICKTGWDFLESPKKESVEELTSGEENLSHQSEIEG
ncbi:MAG TPA: MarC family protein, partial [Chitinophagaceae bacterium]